MNIRPKILAMLLIILASSACGGGGGGSGPANAKVHVSPSGIDTGDTTQVSASLHGFNKTQIAVKFKYPNNFSYLRHSSLVIAGDLSDDSGPFIRASDASNTYLIFKVDTTDLGLEEDDELLIYFSLLGETNLPVGSIAIDVDENIGDSSFNFQITDPRFTAQADASIHIGPAPSPTPSENQT